MSIEATSRPETRELRRFDLSGVLCVHPDALDMSFAATPVRPAPYHVIDGVAIVSCAGPLTFADEYFSTYARLISDCWDAFADPSASAVAINFHSLGGTARGMLTTAQALRQMADEARKPFLAYVSGDCCSASFALACAADKLLLRSPDSQVGGVGSFLGRKDETVADAQAGVRMVYVSSAPAKLFGNPHVPISDEERADMQRIVDSTSQQITGWVAARRGIPADQVVAQGARAYLGQEACRLQLADGIVGSIDTLGSYVRALSAPTEVTTMTLAEIAKALAEIAAGTGPEAEVAAGMLAKLKGEGEPTPAAESTPTKVDDDDEEAAKAKQPPAAVPLAAAAQTVAPVAHAMSDALVQALARVAELEAQAQCSARDRYFEEHAARISPQLKAVLANKPLAEIEMIVDALAVRPQPKAGLGVVRATQGAATEAQSVVTPMQAQVAARITRQMGLTTPSKRANRVINGVTYYDVREDFVPTTLDLD